MRLQGIVLMLFLCSGESILCQSSADCHLQLSIPEAADKQPLTKVLAEVSRTSHVSVVAEIESGLEVKVPAGTDVSTLLAAVAPSLHCAAVENVLYISDDKVVTKKGNLLNFSFDYFEIPSNVGRFRLMLRSRLDHEGFSPSTRQIISPGSGFIPADADLHPLRIETLRKTTARELLLRVAAQQVLSSVIEFPSSPPNLPEEKLWHVAEQRWLWTTSHYE